MPVETNCIKSYLTYQKKLQVLILPGYILYFLTVLYFHISIRIFSALFVCLVFDGFLQLICFRMFCSKRSTTLENTYLPSCWFYCVGALYIEFRFCKTFPVTNSVTTILFIETLSTFRSIKCWFTLYLHMYVLY